MRVSKLLIWILAVLASLCFAMTPIFAGDHPWTEDESTGGSGDGGEPDEGDINPDDPHIIDPTGLDSALGSPLFWWDLITDGVFGEGGADNASADQSQETGNQTGGNAY